VTIAAMARLTLPHLEGHLVYAETSFVPPAALWEQIDNEPHHDVGYGLNGALGALEEAKRSMDGVPAHIDFNRKAGQSKMSEKSLRQRPTVSKTPRRRRPFSSTSGSPAASWKPPMKGRRAPRKPPMKDRRTPRKGLLAKSVDGLRATSNSKRL
jgi:hypothetical protein